MENNPDPEKIMNSFHLSGHYALLQPDIYLVLRQARSWKILKRYPSSFLSSVNSLFRFTYTEATSRASHYCVRNRTNKIIRISHIRKLDTNIVILELSGSLISSGSFQTYAITF